MSWQIIKQPDGAYCIFSTICDNVICYHMQRDDLVKEFEGRATGGIAERVDEVLAELKLGKEPYYQFTMSYPEMMNTIAECNGIDARDKIKKMIEEDSP